MAVGVDGSPVAVRALDQASDEAARRGVALHVVYAGSDHDEAGPVLASAASTVRQRHPGPAGGGCPPRRAALWRRRRERVTAPRSPPSAPADRAGPPGPLLGSVSRRPAVDAPGPLPVVRGDHPCGDGGGVRPGLADDTDADVAAYAFRKTERRGARLRVLHSRTHRHITPEPPSPMPATSPGRRTPVPPPGSCAGTGGGIPSAVAVAGGCGLS
uniref:Universal stress protein n=1 Tax=Streptomyces sp. NBC_00093 TaxID=2975649 RepID=A0AAU2AFT1_9ACTN